MAGEPTRLPSLDDPALNRCVELLADYRRLVARDAGYLRSLAGCCRGETVFCLGNGPSLGRQDAGLLAGANVVATNHGYRFLQGVRPARVWNLVVDTARLDEAAPGLAECGHATFCAPFCLTSEWLRLAERWPAFRVLPAAQSLHWDGAAWALAARDTPLCSFHLPDELAHCGQSVIFGAIQLAVYFGARTVVLLGVDMDYQTTQTHFIPEVKHLNVSYDYETHARSVFVHFRRSLEAMGVRLLNATDGGRVEVLERITLENAVATTNRIMAETRTVSAIVEELTAWRAKALVDQVPSGRSVVLWGANPIAVEAGRLLATRGVPVVAVVDRSAPGYETPDQLLARLKRPQEASEPFFLVCSRSARDSICVDLAGLGYSGPNHVGALPDVACAPATRSISS